MSKAISVSGIMDMSPAIRRLRPPSIHTIASEEESSAKQNENSQSELPSVEELKLVQRQSCISSTNQHMPDMTIIPARQAVARMIEEYKQSIACIPNF